VLGEGKDVCPNCTQVSERKLLTAIAETVRASIGHPALVNQFEEAFSKHWNVAQRARASPVESEGLTAEIRSMTAKRDRVIRALEEGAGAFTSVKDRLRDLEGQLRDLHQRHAAALDAERAKALGRVERPSPAQLLAAFGDMEAIFMTAPAKANRALQERLTAIVVTPR
jgi:septal ring factor EnvC (AmiA/AmiB activator)